MVRLEKGIQKMKNRLNGITLEEIEKVLRIHNDESQAHITTIAAKQENL